jgi:hypothetical protein
MTDGRTLLATTTGDFLQPAAGGAVVAAVDDSTRILVGDIVLAAGGGYYAVYSVPDGTHVELLNNGYTGAAAPFSAVPAGATIVLGAERRSQKGARGMPIFSGLRRMQVTPAGLPGLTCWLRDEYTASSSNVSQWTDKSGNGRHATSSGGNRPVVSTAAGVGNHEIYTFAQANYSFMTLGAKSNFLTASAFTIYALIYAGAASGKILNDNYQSSTTYFALRRNSGLAALAYTDSVNAPKVSNTSSVSNSTWTKLVFAYDGSKNYCRQSGGSDAGSTANPLLAASMDKILKVGGNSVGSGELPIEGSIAEIAIYNQFHSVAIQDMMFAYQLRYFGV